MKGVPIVIGGMKLNLQTSVNKQLKKELEQLVKDIQASGYRLCGTINGQGIDELFTFVIKPALERKNQYKNGRKNDKPMGFLGNMMNVTSDAHCIETFISSQRLSVVEQNYLVNQAMSNLGKNMLQISLEQKIVKSSLYFPHG